MMDITAEVRRAVRELAMIPGIHVMVCPPGGVKPDYIRFPKPGERCFTTGLSLSALRRLIKESNGKIIVRTGKLKASAQLIDRESLVSYIDSLPVATEYKASNS